MTRKKRKTSYACIVSPHKPNNKKRKKRVTENAETKKTRHQSTQQISALSLSLYHHHHHHYNPTSARSHPGHQITNLSPPNLAKTDLPRPEQTPRLRNREADPADKVLPYLHSSSDRANVKARGRIRSNEQVETGCACARAFTPMSGEGWEVCSECGF